MYTKAWEPYESEPYVRKVNNLPQHHHIKSWTCRHSHDNTKFTLIKSNFVHVTIVLNTTSCKLLVDAKDIGYENWYFWIFVKLKDSSVDKFTPVNPRFTEYMKLTAKDIRTGNIRPLNFYNLNKGGEIHFVYNTDLEIQIKGNISQNIENVDLAFWHSKVPEYVQHVYKRHEDNSRSITALFPNSLGSSYYMNNNDFPFQTFGLVLIPVYNGMVNFVKFTHTSFASHQIYKQNFIEVANIPYILNCKRFTSTFLEMNIANLNSLLLRLCGGEKVAPFVLRRTVVLKYSYEVPSRNVRNIGFQLKFLIMKETDLPQKVNKFQYNCTSLKPNNYMSIFQCDMKVDCESQIDEKNCEYQTKDCPQGSVLVGSKCLTLFTNDTSWAQANSYCENRGERLIQFDGEEKSREDKDKLFHMLNTLVDSADNIKGVHIGKNHIYRTCISLVQFINGVFSLL